MAENPRFNNSGMFTDASEDYSEITPDNKSEVLATQGNVINSIKVFWNNIRTKLAYAISRPDYIKQVGGNYVPIFVDTNGVVQECQPTTIQTNIASTGIITIPTDTIPNDNIYTGTTVCIDVSNNSASGSDSDLQIQHNSSASPVKYPSGVTVRAKDISNSDLLLATFCKNSTSSSNNFWILLNKINTVVSTTENGGHPDLMTATDKAKLETIEMSANNYILPKATDTSLGGIQLGYTTNETNRNYKLQTDNNGNGYVSVPWTDTDTHHTALLKVGGTGSKENQITTNGKTYLQIVEADRVTSQRLIKGTKSISVTSDSKGDITIEGTDSKYPGLLNEGNTKNYDEDTQYTVYGPGLGMANQNNYLRGDGSWGPVAASMGRMSASINNGTYDPSKSNSFSGTLKVTYNGSPIQFALLRDNNFKVSDSNGSLLIDGISIKPNASLDGNSIALIIPIGNLSLKPQILHFESTSTATIMD